MGDLRHSTTARIVDRKLGTSKPVGQDGTNAVKVDDEGPELTIKDAGKDVSAPPVITERP